MSHPAFLIALRRARDVTDRDFAQPLTLNSMAQAAHLSKFHFARAFTKAYGETTGVIETDDITAYEELKGKGVTFLQEPAEHAVRHRGPVSQRFRELVQPQPAQALWRLSGTSPRWATTLARQACRFLRGAGRYKRQG